MLILFSWILTSSSGCLASDMATNTSQTLQQQLRRSDDHGVEKQIEEVHKLLEDLHTLPTSEPPYILDKIYSFWTMQQELSMFPTTDVPSYATSLIPEETFSPILPGFGFHTPKLPQHPYYTPTYQYQYGDRDPMDLGIGTLSTWATWFKPLRPNTRPTKSTTRTMHPDPITGPITESTTTAETTYNPVKGWYDNQKTNPLYWLHSYTDPHYTDPVVVTYTTTKAA